jgi:hypothetical protein
MYLVIAAKILKNITKNYSKKLALLGKTALPLHLL